MPTTDLYLFFLKGIDLYLSSFFVCVINSHSYPIQILQVTKPLSQKATAIAFYLLCHGIGPLVHIWILNQYHILLNFNINKIINMAGFKHQSSTGYGRFVYVVQ